MAVNLKQLSTIPERLTGGHRLCAGCGASIAVRQLLMGTTDPVVVGCATGCLEVATTIYPYTAWDCPFIHNAFENVAATMSGVETAYRALKKKGKINKDIKFVAFGGDGGTYDIGLQALSGMLERTHRVVYICYNNEGYMNCLSTSSLIITRDGLKKITEIKVGDEVAAFNQKTHQLVFKKCSGVFDNGKKEVSEVQTLHHSIKATGNHPFLVLNRDKNSFIWKTLENLKIEDEIVVSKNFSKKYQYGYISLSKDKPTQLINQNLLASNQYFELEKIESIRPIGIEPTLDLRVEDEHNFIADGIVVHNTGIQRSGATPCGASTTTAPSGKVSFGKPQMPKDLTAIVVAHNIPYAAQVTISHWNDLITKAQKAFSADGPAFLNVLSPCHRGWRIPMETVIDIAKLAVETGFWPLYEVENGKWHITYKPKQRKPIIEYIKLQGRFKHLLTPENQPIIDNIQKSIDEYWARLEKLAAASAE